MLLHTKIDLHNLNNIPTPSRWLFCRYLDRIWTHFEQRSIFHWDFSGGLQLKLFLFILRRIFHRDRHRIEPGFASFCRRRSMRNRSLKIWTCSAYRDLPLALVRFVPSFLNYFYTKVIKYYLNIFEQEWKERIMLLPMIFLPPFGPVEHDLSTWKLPSSSCLPLLWSSSHLT